MPKNQIKSNFICQKGQDHFHCNKNITVHDIKSVELEYDAHYKKHSAKLN